MDSAVIFLLSLNVDPNIQDKNGYTALHYVIKNNHIRIIKNYYKKVLIEINDNKSKVTPIILGKKNREVMEIFRKKGFMKNYFLNMI